MLVCKRCSFFKECQSFGLPAAVTHQVIYFINESMDNATILAYMYTDLNRYNINKEKYINALRKIKSRCNQKAS